jgi:hypothetical protein
MPHNKINKNERTKKTANQRKIRTRRKEIKKNY